MILRRLSRVRPNDAICTCRWFSSTLDSLPDSAEVVVVGGGIIGVSTAYHLAKHGCNDVLLLERDQLTSGTTWHAAGLMVTFGSTSETSVSIRQYSKELYANILEKETEQSTGFKECGFIELGALIFQFENRQPINVFL